MSELPEIERVPSGVTGLDTILHGGFPRGGIHLIQGTPGADKTIAKLKSNPKTHEPARLDQR